jgi:hypothetical protein
MPNGETQTTRRVRPTEPVPPARRTTRALLACGVAAGLVFALVSAPQMAARDGFDPINTPLSLLGRGDLGWIQVINFLLTGVLTLAAAVGMRRALSPGRAATWAPLLTGLYGLGVFLTGVFASDPSYGFPPGAPDGPADPLSWQNLVHDIAAGVGFISMAAACFVFTRRFADLRQWGWALYSVGTGLALFPLSWPDAPAMGIRMTAAAVLTYGFVAVMSSQLRSRSAQRPAAR